jgi:putative membrane protein
MVKTVIFIILVILVVLFVLQNTQVVETQFIAWKVSMSRSLLLLGTFLVGIIAGWLLRRPRQRG